MTNKQYFSPVVVNLGGASSLTLGVLSGGIEPNAKRPA